MILKKTNNVNLSREENELIFEREQEERLLDICYAAAQWEKTGDEVFSESSFSVTLGEETISGKLTFDLYDIEVEMTSPMQMTMHRNIIYHHRYWNRYGTLTKNGEKDGPATDQCRKEAVRTLMGMYNDWKEIQNRKHTILEKYREMPEKKRIYFEKERERVCAAREKELMLSHLSGEVKRCFKAGLMDQKEYVPIRRVLHEKIVSYKDQTRIPNFFNMYFSEELGVCRTVRDPERLIWQVFEEDGSAQGVTKKNDAI